MKGTEDARRSTSIRQRIVVAMVTLVVVSLALTGGIVIYLEGRSDRARIDNYLLRTRDEFARFAQDGVDTETGQPFDGPQQLLRTFLRRTVIDENEGELGIVDGRLRLISSDDVSLRPEEDQELMDHILPLTTDETTRLDTYETSIRTYRYHITPVQYPTQTGALVHVYDLDALDAELMELLYIFVTVALATSLISAVVASTMVGRLLRPIEELRQAAESIGDTDLTSRVPLRGNDDLTRLSRTVNRMLDRVQGAIETQRGLLDDVGHELRTPITIVRGHLELVDPDDPADVRSTRDLAIDELDRMGNLVGDLLILAKANQSDFVQPEWFSLATLTDQVLEKSRALGNRAWRLRHIESVDAWLDPSRITQAWLQLAANAVKYSDEGSPITLSSKVVRGWVHLSVEDRGVGIAEDDLERIRSRFGRGSNTGQIVGAGLGLSIVETISEAHGGSLEIESELGVGSTFTIIIPLTPKELVHEHDPDS